MPSEEFMRAVLETGRAKPEEQDDDQPVAEVVAEEPLVLGGEEEEEQQQPTAEAAADTEEEEEEVSEDEPEEPTEDDADEDEGETEEEPESHEDAPVYDGVWNDYFGSPEEVFTALQEAQEALSTSRKREGDTRAWGNNNSRRAAEAERTINELREALAYATGRVEATEAQQGGDAADFQEWAESAMEENARAGFEALAQQALETGDRTWVDQYLEMWGEEEPYHAASARNHFDLTVATLRLEQGRQEQQPQVNGSGLVINPVGQVALDVLEMLREQHEDLSEGHSVLQGTIKAIADDVQLTAALQSGDPVKVSWAITQGRSTYLSGQRGASRRLSKGAQRELAGAKARATVATGTRQVQAAREEPEVPKEFEGSMAHFKRWGMVREQ